MALHTHSANFHGVLANELTIHGLAFLLSFSHPFWAVLGSTRISGDFLRHDLKQLSLMCIMLLFFLSSSSSAACFGVGCTRLLDWYGDQGLRWRSVTLLIVSASLVQIDLSCGSYNGFPFLVT